MSVTDETARAFGTLHALIGERKRIAAEIETAFGMVEHPSHRLQKQLAANAYRLHHAMRHNGEYIPYA